MPWHHMPSQVRKCAYDCCNCKGQHRPYSAELPASYLKEGLTKPKRTRDTMLEGRTGLIAGISEVKDGKIKEIAVKSGPVAPQSDLPPVLAGPGR